MSTLHLVILAANILTVIGDEEFRADYDFHESAQGWFKLNKVPTVWGLAELRCHYEGGVLASPLNENIKAALNTIIKQNEDIGRFGVHTGVHNRMSTAEYTSIEGVSLSAMPVKFSGMFPDDYASAKYCMRTLPEGEMLAGNCTDLLPYICYKNKDAQMKLTVCGTIDKDYHFYHKTGHCYKFHFNPASWSHAFLACDAEGGHLAIINSGDEANILKDLYSKYPPEIIVGNGYKDGAHIGYLDWYQNGTWRTIYGQSLKAAGYGRWGPGEPNNQGNSQYCGGVYRSGLLDDTYCDLPFPFICEKDPKSLTSKDCPPSKQ